MKMEQIVHVGTSKVRLTRRVKRNWPRFSVVTTTHKQTDYERGNEGCFKGHNVGFMAYRRCCPSTTAGSLRVCARGHGHRSQVTETKTGYQNKTYF